MTMRLRLDVVRGAPLFAVFAGGIDARYRDDGMERAIRQFLNARHIIVAVGVNVDTAAGH